VETQPFFVEIVWQHRHLYRMVFPNWEMPNGMAAGVSKRFRTSVHISGRFWDWYAAIPGVSCDLALIPFPWRQVRIFLSSGLFFRD
jgi:hypothetical protein